MPINSGNFGGRFAGMTLYAWASFDNIGSTIINLKMGGLSSVVRVSAGVYDLTYTTALPNAVSPVADCKPGLQNDTSAFNVAVNNITTATIRIQTNNVSTATDFSTNYIGLYR